MIYTNVGNVCSKRGFFETPGQYTEAKFNVERKIEIRFYESNQTEIDVHVVSSTDNMCEIIHTKKFSTEHNILKKKKKTERNREKARPSDQV